MVDVRMAFDRFEAIASRSLEAASALPCDAAISIGRGDLVLVKAPQFAGAIDLFWSTMAAGAIFVPVDSEWPAYAVEKAAGRLSPRLIVATGKDCKQLEALFPSAMVIDADEHAAKRIVIATGPGVAIPAEAPAAYLFTSGTTDLPKAVCLSRAALAHSAMVTIDAFGWRQGERLLNLPELHSMSGLRNSLIAAPMAGMEWLPSPGVERPDIFTLVDLIADSRCDHIVAGPSLVRQLAMVARRLPSDALVSVKAIYCTGAALPRDAVVTVYERFRTPVINYYGLTETGGICLSQDRRSWTIDDTSLGRPVGCEARLIGPDGQTGDAGELQIESAQLMSGYVDDIEATRVRLSDGWLRTGDVMARDEAGAYHLRGREALFIKTQSTDRIHPEEVETAMIDHDAVIDAALAGVADGNGGERLVAFVVLSHGTGSLALKSELANFVEEKLGKSRRPQQIEFVESLPRNSVGKLKRGELRGMVS